MKTFKEFLTEAVMGGGEVFKRHFIDYFYNPNETTIEGTAATYKLDAKGDLVPAGEYSGKVYPIKGLKSSDKETDGAAPVAINHNGIEVYIHRRKKGNANLIKVFIEKDGKKEERYIAIKKINKNNSVKITPMNKGDAAEGTLLVALYLKFSNARRAKSEIINDVKAEDVHKIVRDEKNWKITGNKAEMTFPGKTVIDAYGGKDVVDFSLTLKASVVRGMLSEDRESDVMELCEKSIKYVNSEDTTRLVTLVHLNGAAERISLSGVGPLDEKGTKVDLKIKIESIDPSVEHPILIMDDISVKNNSNQLAQAGVNGLEAKVWASASDFLKKLTGKGFDSEESLRKLFNTHYSKGEKKRAFGILTRLFSKMLAMKARNLNEFKKVLVNMFNMGGFNNENMVIVDVAKNVRMSMADVEREINKRESFTVIPVSGDKDKFFLTTLIKSEEMPRTTPKKYLNIAKLRFKFEATTTRVYFEQETDFKNLFKKK